MTRQGHKTEQNRDRRKGSCSIAETNGSLQGTVHARWSIMSLHIRRIMHENLYITFRTFPYKPFHENALFCNNFRLGLTTSIQLILFGSDILY